MRKVFGFILLSLLVVTTAWAQQPGRGNGRLMGKVLDEQGKPLEAVVIKATFPEAPGVSLGAKTDKKGEWAIDDVAEGTWQLLFQKPAYDDAKASSEVDDSGRSKSVDLTLKKTFNPNEFIKTEGAKAEKLMASKKPAEARAVYEGIAARVPQVAAAMQQYIARTYMVENNPTKAVEALRLGLEKDPNSFEAKISLVMLLSDAGSIEEAYKIAQTVDESKLKDPQMFLSLGLALINKQKPGDAVPFLDKAAVKFPKAPETYYYRANANISLLNAEKDPKSPARTELLNKVKADLKMYLDLAGNRPEAAAVRQLLEQLDKA